MFIIWLRPSIYRYYNIENILKIKFEKEVKFDVDLQELFDDLSYKDQAYFLAENITSANDDTLVQELINRGYECVKG